MSRARHAKRASGGRVFYAGGESNVAKEAAEKKRGGAVKKKSMGKVMGGKSKPRMDRRARGGRIGSDKSPYTSAASPAPRSES